MPSFGFTYIVGETPVHRCDARAKIVVLFVYSIALLAMPVWWGVLVLAALLAVAVATARLPLGRLNRMLVPVFLLAVFSFAFNIAGNPTVEGLATGALVAVRMLALVAASFVVCLTTTSTELLAAFRSIISPLRYLRVPVDDIAFTLALSVRFIPVIEQEFARIRAAQVSRGAESAGSFTRKLEIWGVAFTSLFVGLFRHADSLAAAMDARCYGAAEQRTSLPKGKGKKG